MDRLNIGKCGLPCGPPIASWRYPSLAQQPTNSFTPEGLARFVKGVATAEADILEFPVAHCQESLPATRPALPEVDQGDPATNLIRHSH